MSRLENLHDEIMEFVKKEVKERIVDELNADNPDLFLWDETEFKIPFEAIEFSLSNEYNDESYYDEVQIYFIQPGKDRYENMCGYEYFCDGSLEDLGLVKAFQSFENAEYFHYKVRNILDNILIILEKFGKDISIKITRDNVEIKKSNYVASPY
jgi:hypothetical protein